MSELEKLVQNLKTVEIDDSGKFKYILVKVHETGQKEEKPLKTVVRGYKSCDYHADILDRLDEDLCKISKQLTTECVGGGRIERQGNKLHVYGYSQGFGKADHAVTVDILKKEFPGFDVDYSNEGY